MDRRRSPPLLLMFMLMLTLTLSAPMQVLASGTEDEGAAAEDAASEDSSDGDGDSDCGAEATAAEGEGPSLEEHGILALAAAVADPRSLVLGWRQYGDCLLMEQTYRRAKGFGRLHDVDVSMAAISNASITHVLARPVSDAGGATRVERRGGGIGHNWLHAKIRAPRGYGLHYEVRVYGVRT